MTEREWLHLDDVRTLDDLDRLHPHEYARLAGRPASMLDVVAVKLEVTEAFVRFVDQTNKTIEDFSKKVGEAFAARDEKR